MNDNDFERLKAKSSPRTENGGLPKRQRQTQANNNNETVYSSLFREVLYFFFFFVLETPV